MRRLLALGCCVGFLAYGLVAGAAHVHAAADHHDETRGPHRIHAHLGHGAHHGPDGHDHPASLDSSESHIEGLHVEHHHCDTIELKVNAHRPSAPGFRVMPATVAATATVEQPSFASLRGADSSEPLRGPPSRGPLPARAPPA